MILKVNLQTSFAKLQEIKRDTTIILHPSSFLSSLVSKSLKYLYSLFSSSLKDVETVGNIQEKALSFLLKVQIIQRTTKEIAKKPLGRNS